MKKLSLAVLTALSLCACATVDPTPVSSQKVEASIPQNASVEAQAETVQTSDNTNMDQDSGSSAPDYSNETLLYGAMTKYELTSFVELIRGAGQEAALEQDDIRTVFAPNNAAFEYAGRPSDTAAFLSDHIVAGRFDLQDLKAAISEKGGPIELKTLSGKTLTAYHMDGKIKLSGAGGVLVTITQSDMMHSNGVMHHISDVLGR